jgi:hypothetical protein
LISKAINMLHQRSYGGNLARIVGRIKSMLASWKASLLAIDGKVQLV